MGWAARSAKSIANKAKGPKPRRRARGWEAVPLADRPKWSRHMLARALGVEPKKAEAKA